MPLLASLSWCCWCSSFSSSSSSTGRSRRARSQPCLPSHTPPLCVSQLTMPSQVSLWQFFQTSVEKNVFCEKCKTISRCWINYRIWILYLYHLYTYNDILHTNSFRIQYSAVISEMLRNSCCFFSRSTPTTKWRPSKQLLLQSQLPHADPVHKPSTCQQPILWKSKTTAKDSLCCCVTIIWSCCFQLGICGLTTTYKVKQ